VQGIGGYQNIFCASPFLVPLQLEPGNHFIAWTVKVDDAGYFGLGVSSKEQEHNYSDISMNGWSYFSHGNKYSGQTYPDVYGTLNVGDVITIKLNLNTRLLQFLKNGIVTDVQFELPQASLVSHSPIFLSTSLLNAQVSILSYCEE